MSAVQGLVSADRPTNNLSAFSQATSVADFEIAVDAYYKAVTVAELDSSKYPAIVHRRLTDEVDRLKPKVEAESSQPGRIWIWWAQLVPGLLVGHKPISRDAVRDMGPGPYREFVYLESCLAVWLTGNLDRYMSQPKGYKTCLKDARSHLAEKLAQIRAATHEAAH